MTLVAMPPSGEVFVARDSDGQLWLILPPGAGGPERIDDHAVQQAVASHGFALIEQAFDSWEDLERERQRRAGFEAPAVGRDIENFDTVDVERVLHTAERWRDHGRTIQARRLGHRLLEAEVLRSEPALHRRLARFLQELDDVPVLLPTIDSDPAREAQMARMRLVAS